MLIRKQICICTAADDWKDIHLMESVLVHIGLGLSVWQVYHSAPLWQQLYHCLNTPESRDHNYIVSGHLSHILQVLNCDHWTSTILTSQQISLGVTLSEWIPGLNYLMSINTSAGDFNLPILIQAALCEQFGELFFSFFWVADHQGQEKYLMTFNSFKQWRGDRENLRFWTRTVTLHGSTLFYLQSSLLAADFTFVVLRFYFVYLKWVRSKNKIINSFISPNFSSLIFSSWDSLIFCLIFCQDFPTYSIF